MRNLTRRALLVFALGALSCAPAWPGAVGMFGGKVVQGAGQNPPGKWVYIKGRGGSLRRVEVSNARFDYASSVPRGARAAIPADDLKDGTVVQVSAEQDGNGEWVARSVLILQLANQRVLRSSLPQS
jgi:hypothetical protein